MKEGCVALYTEAVRKREELNYRALPWAFNWEKLSTTKFLVADFCNKGEGGG